MTTDLRGSRSNSLANFNIPEFDPAILIFEVTVQITSHSRGDAEHGILPHSEGYAAEKNEDSYTITANYNIANPNSKLVIKGGENNLAIYFGLVMGDSAHERHVEDIGEVSLISVDDLKNFRKSEFEPEMFFRHDNKFVPIKVKVVRKKGKGALLSSIVINFNPDEIPKTMEYLKKYHAFYFTNCK